MPHPVNFDCVMTGVGSGSGSDADVVGSSEARQLSVEWRQQRLRIDITDDRRADSIADSHATVPRPIGPLFIVLDYLKW